MSEKSPYSRPPPFRFLCVSNRTVQRAAAFVQEGNQIKVSSFKTTTTSALYDGTKVIFAPKSGEEAAFEEGTSYVVKNYTLSMKYGQECIFLGATSSKFKSAPLVFTNEECARATEALCPSSVLVCGDDGDLYKKGGYSSLSGFVERLQVVRMMSVRDGDVPILDLHVRSGSKLIEVSLWRDEALTDLKMGDQIEISHLKPSSWPNGRWKFNSTSHTRVKVCERQVRSSEVQIIGVSEEDEMFILLGSNYEEFRLPAELYHGTSEELLSELPMTLLIEHANMKVVKFSKL